MSRMVEVRVAGQNYRVVSSAPEAEVRRLADAVNAKLAELFPKGRGQPPQALLLAAMALAHDVEEEREKREQIEGRTRDMLQRAVSQINVVLGTPDGPEHEGPEEEHAEGEGVSPDLEAGEAADRTDETDEGPAGGDVSRETPARGDVSRET